MEKVVGQGARTQYPVELPQAIEIWPYLGDIMSEYASHRFSTTAAHVIQNTNAMIP